MNRTSRIGIAAAVAALAAAFAGSALAAFAPSLAVTGSRLGADEAFGPTVSFTLPASSDAFARLTIYVPQNYTLSSPASPSSAIGNVTGTVQLGDRGNAVAAVKGSIVGAPTSTTPSACDAGTHQATWTMNLTVDGQPLVIPMFVDAASGGETAYASYRVVACPPPADLPAGTAGRAPLGARLLSARFNLDAFTGGSNGEQLWRAVWTPYTAKTTQGNTGASVETQSIVRVPTVVKLSAKRTKHARSTTVLLTGVVTEDVYPVAGVTVTVGSGPRTTQLKQLRVVKTDAKGRFALRVSITQTRWFGASATIPERGLPATTCKSTFSYACTSATIGSARVVGKAVKVAR